MKNDVRMTLNGLELSVHLGWPTHERLAPQAVIADITLTFVEPPLACQSDQLQDTFCYDQLIKTIHAELATRHFRLVEHLAYTLHHIIQHYVGERAQVSIAVTKKPAIVGLTGGVKFFYGDLL